MPINNIKGFHMDFYDVDSLEALPFEHYHDAFELSFFLTARLNIFIKDMNYPLQDGDMLFISEYELHKIVYIPGTPYKRYVINFQKQFILPFLQSMGVEALLDRIDRKDYKKASLNLIQQDEMKYLFQSLYKLHRRPERRSGEEQKLALTHSYLFLILSRLGELLREAPPAFPHKKESRIQEMIRYIDGCYQAPLHLEDMERAFNLSKYHISHIFKEVTGFSFSGYLQHRRVIEAQKMLKKPQSDITDVYMHCGFTNLQHFYKVFKKIAGVSPARYKKMHGNTPL